MKKVSFLCSFLFISFYLFSMDWPSPGALMIKNFGWNDGGIPHLGISFEADEKLAAADNGELLFHRRGTDTASRLPSPLGSWVAIDHGDGIVSIYGRFDDKSPDNKYIPALEGRMEKGAQLGEPGISGWSSAKGFFFQLFDRKERRWINPSLIIPSQNATPPSIMSVRLKDTQGKLLNPYQIGNLSQGRYIVTVDAMTRNTRGNPLAPYRIICTLNGSEAGVLNFETYSARDGSLMVYRNGLVPVRQVYAPVPAYEVADVWFSRGQTTLEIITQDIAGNVRNVVYRFLVE
ncbi:MAG: M23 family metallopeptidase [Treponema sp.]|jgi:hypothetical protein|nr:M23 family metallopeptidase [Treponema sp.]